MDRFLATLKSLLGPHYPTLIFAGFFAVVFGAILLRLCWIFGGSDNVEVARYVLLCLVGMLLGWVFGMFFSPYSKEDAERFQFLGKTIAAFASGYVLSKVDFFISALVEKAGDRPGSVPWEGVGVFASSFLLAAIVVFVNRSYSLQTRSPTVPV